MNCYKCGTDQELSAKKVDKHGNITFICKPCRREATYAYQAKTNPSRVSAPPISKAWVAATKEKNSALAAKYRDAKFMQSRGLE